MIFEEKTITLKNRKKVVLKSPEEGSGEAFLSFITQACGETEFLLRSPEDWENVSAKDEEVWIRKARQSPDTLMISCYADGKIAGNCEIQFNTAQKTRHRATVAIALLREYWGIGLGSALFEELIKAANARDGVEIIELSFIEGNERAKALYEKFGFRIIGEHPDAIKMRNGSFAKEYPMQKYL